MKKNKKIYMIFNTLVVVISLFSFGMAYSQVQTGINTNKPKATLDINGDLIVRDLPVIKDKEVFYAIGHDQNNKIVSLSKDITSYSTYLGFSPMANRHKEELPITLESGYITTIQGFGIGACYGVMVKFTIHFIGTKYVGAVLQAISTIGDNKYSEVTLASNESIFNKPLEILAKASGCSADSGHTLSFNGQSNKISVSFMDSPRYYPNAGVFVINDIVKVKQTN